MSSSMQAEFSWNEETYVRRGTFIKTSKSALSHWLYISIKMPYVKWIHDSFICFHDCRPSWITGLLNNRPLIIRHTMQQHLRIFFLILSTSPKSGTGISHIWARKSVYFYDWDKEWIINCVTWIGHNASFMCNLGCTSVGKLWNVESISIFTEKAAFNNWHAAISNHLVRLDKYAWQNSIKAETFIVTHG